METVPRHEEIPEKLARKICKGLVSRISKRNSENNQSLSNVRGAVLIYGAQCAPYIYPK